MSAAEIIEQIRSLPAEEKSEVVEQILAEFGPEGKGAGSDLTPEQGRELEQRLASFEAEPQRGIPLEQVEAEMKQRFGWK